MRRVKFTEEAFSVQKKIFSKGKKHFNHKNKGKNDGGNHGNIKQKFPPCEHCKRTTHREKYYW